MNLKYNIFFLRSATTQLFDHDALVRTQLFVNIRLGEETYEWKQRIWYGKGERFSETGGFFMALIWESFFS